MTQVELADKLAKLGRRIPPQGLARLEAGERRVDVDDVLVLALALGVSVQSLLAPTVKERDEGVFHAVGNTFLDQDHYRRVLTGLPMNPLQHKTISVDNGMPAGVLDVEVMRAQRGEGGWRLVPVDEMAEMMRRMVRDEWEARTADEKREEDE